MKFEIFTTTTVSCKTIVEAESEEEALDIAADRSVMGKPPHMLGSPAVEWVITDFDGEVDVDSMTADEV